MGSSSLAFSHTSVADLTQGWEAIINNAITVVVLSVAGFLLRWNVLCITLGTSAVGFTDVDASCKTFALPLAAGLALVCMTLVDTSIAVIV
jgi:hypothetical protein